MYECMYACVHNCISVCINTLYMAQLYYLLNAYRHSNSLTNIADRSDLSIGFRNRHLLQYNHKINYVTELFDDRQNSFNCSRQKHDKKMLIVWSYRLEIGYYWLLTRFYVKYIGYYISCLQRSTCLPW